MGATLTPVNRSAGDPNFGLEETDPPGVNVGIFSVGAHLVCERKISHKRATGSISKRLPKLLEKGFQNAEIYSRAPTSYKIWAVLAEDFFLSGWGLERLMTSGFLKHNEIFCYVFSGSKYFCRQAQ